MPIAFAQAKTGNSAGAYTETASITLDTAVTAGNSLFFWVAHGDVQDNNISVTDNRGNTWTKVIDFSNTTDASTIMLWRVGNANAGTTTITYTNTVPAYKQLSFVVLEFSGLDTSGTGLDSSATNAIDGYTQTHTSGSMTTTNANDLIMGALSGNSATSVLSSQSGQSWAAIYQTGSAPFGKIGVQYKIVSSAGSYQSTMVDSTEFMTTSNAITGYKAAGGGGPNPPAAGTSLLLGVGT